MLKYEMMQNLHVIGWEAKGVKFQSFAHTVRSFCISADDVIQMGRKCQMQLKPTKMPDNTLDVTYIKSNERYHNINELQNELLCTLATRLTQDNCF